MIFTVMNLCGITDMEESSQWTENPLMCDESTECYSSMTAACKPLRDAHNDICSGCPLPSDMDCAWAEIMQACDVTDLEDESQWNLDKICNKGGACYPTFGTCGYMRTIQIEECGEEQCTWSGGQSEGTAPVSLQSTDQVLPCLVLPLPSHLLCLAAWGTMRWPEVANCGKQGEWSESCNE